MVENNRKIKIMSRYAIEELADRPFVISTALISITDAGCDFAALTNKPQFVLQLAFDDVDNEVFVDELGENPSTEEKRRIEEEYNMFTNEQAEQIAAFFHEVWDKVDVFICQCEYGQSRSAAVAAAIMEYRDRNGIEIFANDNYYPNKLVFRKVFEALNKD